MTSTTKSTSPTHLDRNARSLRPGGSEQAGSSGLPDLSAVFDGLRARRGRARRIVARGVAHYDRGRILPRLVPATPAMLADRSAENGARIVATLERALRAERARGRAGHWTYSLDRHIGLAQALAAEKAALRTETGRRALGSPDASRRIGGSEGHTSGPR